MSASATLPMYDWPETRDANDKLWGALYQSLKDHKIDAPKELARAADPMKSWQDPDLILGQTCGLPFVNLLTQQTELIGTPAYDIECGAGSYYSVLIVREDAEIQEISDLKDKIFGFSNTISQSGYAAFHYHLNAAGLSRGFLGAEQLTGSHRESIKAVASAQVDVASIDAVSWALAERHEPATSAIRILDCTAPTPGLPLITAGGNKTRLKPIRLAVIEALASLDEGVRDDLLLMGFAQTTDQDYEVIKSRFETITQPRTQTG
ncbi:phosphate/phosphite/phosphonate ABC transporter substrate-binding protein [Sneathiella marina]|uniref:Phosphate/phosphite/phosphonate ABC transporter substrate-binding protein n=1 Tax=Sneathiella marina TaxID=2950108 RepID=A0ABY4W3E0_9PROT|nr:PhnD/SsuA/transferrin family substrate-binding protein [Sneathiella marina]USG61710.1 phosphate/phosphite/phosphonate ABC transporter substrate-binding protein [Sneathiella marina]